MTLPIWDIVATVDLLSQGYIITRISRGIVTFYNFGN